MANHSAAVLRNKGISVSIRETEQSDDDGPWQVARNGKGDPKVTTAWLRFDGNTLADLEEAYGDLGAYQQATGLNPFTTIRRTISIVMGWDDLHPRGADGRPEASGKLCSGCRRAGLAMMEGKNAEYQAAIGAALALANGLDPTQVVRLLEQGEKANQEMVKARDAALDELLTDDAPEDPTPTGSTSMDGSANGSEPVAATTSSGG